MLETESLGDIYSPLKGIRDPPSSPPLVRQRPNDLKVEVPLSPPHSDRLPPWKNKSVSFSEALPELICELPPPIAISENSSDNVDGFFEKMIKPVAVKAERAIEQEQLQEIDTTLRVQVPTMDFSPPTAPWEAMSHRPKDEDEDELLKKTLTEMKALHFSNHTWPISGQAERELKWAPFPVALGKVDTQESISDNGFVEEYIETPECVDSESLTWKPEGLRILDELAESEEELEEGDFSEKKDLNSLIRKRKFELELEDDEPISSPSQNVPNAVQNRTQGKQEVDTARTKGNVSRSTDQDTIFANDFSTIGALENYMNIRNGQMTRRKVTSDHYFAKPSQVSQPCEPLDPHRSKRTCQADLQMSSLHTAVLPSPVLSVPASPRWFITSASFLSNRRLSRQVQRLYPSAEYVERDFTLHQYQSQESLQWKAKGTSVHYGTMADEADMLLSPSTGLIWTSLQKIKQRSLPGQLDKSAARERISRTSQRYERLLVLISQNRSTEPDSANTNVQSLDNDDCTALAGFTTFCCSLPDEVQTWFVAGGEEDLAKWIVAAMVKHGMDTDHELKLLQDETVWEVFLRRAGMNAFAAQAILATLKAPDQNKVNAGSMQGPDYGLKAFVKMSLAERFAQFETLLGGRRLLQRVSRVLDARW